MWYVKIIRSFDNCALDASFILTMWYVKSVVYALFSTALLRFILTMWYVKPDLRKVLTRIYDNVLY